MFSPRIEPGTFLMLKHIVLTHGYAHYTIKMLCRSVMIVRRKLLIILIMVVNIISKLCIEPCNMWCTGH